MPERAGEVWVFRTGSLGDALVALPAIQRIRDLHPAARLVLLTNDPGGPIVDAWDILRHAGARFDHAEHYHPGKIGSLLRLLYRIRRARPRALYYLAPTRRSRLQILRDRLFFGFAAGIPRVHGLDRTPPVSSSDPSLPVMKEADRLLELADPTAPGLTRSSMRLLEVPQASREKALALLRAAGWSEDRPLLAFTVGSKMPAKRWAPERFRETGERLMRRMPRAFIALLGSAEEAEVAEGISAGWAGRSVNLVGKTSLIESAAVLERARLYLGNDTGTMHLAAAMGTPSVAVFSARDQAGKWEPYGGHNRVLRAKVECAGCLLITCEARKMECLDRIGVDLVERAAVELLEESS